MRTYDFGVVCVGAKSSRYIARNQWRSEPQGQIGLLLESPKIKQC